MNLIRHTNIAITYFLIVGLLGILLRIFFVTPVPANFRYIVHAHSHTALLGWVYIAITTLIYRLYFLDSGKEKYYRRIFLLTNISILGMMFSFPFQGYALFSITFSTLFLFASYFMAWFIIRNIAEQYKKKYSWKCIKAALMYMVFSSIGPWAIAGVMVTLGKTSIWYKLSIYFYLHFQYNAWFILALCGFVFFLFEKYHMEIKSHDFKNFFKLINAGIFLSFFLSALWIDPPVIIYILAATGAVIQILAFFKFFKMLKNPWQELKFRMSKFQRLLLVTAAVFMIVKILLQSLSAIPYFAELAFNHQDFIIGYLHWTFLGVISISLFAFLNFFNLLKIPKWIFIIYFIGFILSEFLIFFKAIVFWLGFNLFEDYFSTLVMVSALLPLSIYILLVNNYISSENPKEVVKN